MNKLILRILLSPLVFLIGVAFTAAMFMFPFGLATCLGFWYLLMDPFIWLLKKSGVEFEEEFTAIVDNPVLDHFLLTTICLWFPFAVVFLYIKEGRFIINEIFS